MSFFSKLFRIKNSQNPEESYLTIITDKHVRVENSPGQIEEINWGDIKEILLINTDEGPFLPDVWLVFAGDNNSCSLPQGCRGYDQVYDIVSKYEGFDFENVLKSMTCTDNQQFLLWRRN